MTILEIYCGDVGICSQGSRAKVLSRKIKIVSRKNPLQGQCQSFTVGSVQYLFQRGRIALNISFKTNREKILPDNNSECLSRVLSFVLTTP